MMYKIDSLTLMSGADIILDKPAVRIHQPTIKEIALIGEGKFFQSMNIFYIDSTPFNSFVRELEDVSDEDKNDLILNATAYDYLLFLMQITSMSESDNFTTATALANTFFQCILKDYKFVFNSEESIMFLLSENLSDSIVVDRDLFIRFRDISIQIFLLNKFFADVKTEPLSPAAQKIADKMAATEKKIKEMKSGGVEDDSQIARILSVLGVTKELSYLNNLTIYQLFNQFERFNLFTNYDQSLKASFAGASNIELVDWYKKI